MTEKARLTGTGKIAAILSLLFAGTGAGYYFGVTAQEPRTGIDMLVSGLQSSADDRIARNNEGARQVAFVRTVCDKIDDALDETFKAAGVARDFSTAYTPQGDYDYGTCTVTLNGNDIYDFDEIEDFDIESYNGRLDIPVFFKRATAGMTNAQITKVQDALPRTFSTLAPQ